MVTQLSESLIANYEQGVNHLLAHNGFDALNVQDLHHVIVQAVANPDAGDDYEKEYEELQKKLKELER